MNKKLYGADWSIIRNAILVRDDFKCQQCGMLDFRYVQNLIRNDKNYKCPSNMLAYLQVAHLDNDKNNMNESNLITLCPKCHLKLDAPWKKYKRIAYKPFVKPPCE